MQSIWLHRYAAFVAACTFLLVIAGALVTSRQAGMSVPDWPLSFGQLMPPMPGGVFFEHTHRLIASAVGLLVIVLAVWVWRREDRPHVRWLTFGAMIAVLVQGLLGGLTVLMRLPAAISIAHACLAQLFFSATVAIALVTSPRWRCAAERVADHGSPPLPALAAAAPVFVLVQLALGAATRHKLLGVTPHIVGALVTGAVVFFVAVSVLSQHERHAAMDRAARRLLWLTVLQMLLGIAAYLSRIILEGALRPHPLTVAATVAHVAVGALVMAAGVVLALEVFRHVRRAREAAEDPRGAAG